MVFMVISNVVSFFSSALLDMGTPILPGRCGLAGVINSEGAGGAEVVGAAGAAAPAAPSRGR
jgi:hypothetical protein